MSAAPPRPPLRAVLFDAAGTLFELREPVGELYARAAARRGCAIGAWRLGDAFARVQRALPPMRFPGEPAARIAQLEREWWRELVRQCFRAADSSQMPADFDALFDELFELFATPQAWRARPGARETLAELREAGLATAVVSNFDHRLPRLLDALQLLPLFDCVLRAADCGAAKPEPEIFRIALGRLGVGAAEAAFVGDDPAADLAGARAMGLLAIDVRELATLAELPARLGLPRSRSPGAGRGPR